MADTMDRNIWEIMGEVKPMGSGVAPANADKNLPSAKNPP